MENLAIDSNVLNFLIYIGLGFLFLLIFILFDKNKNKNMRKTKKNNFLKYVEEYKNLIKDYDTLLNDANDNNVSFEEFKIKAEISMKNVILNELEYLKDNIDLRKKANSEFYSYEDFKLDIEYEKKLNLLSKHSNLSEFNFYEILQGYVENKAISYESFERQVNGYLDRLSHLNEKYGEVTAKRILKEKVFLGMSSEQLKDSIGEPTKIEKEIMKTKTKDIFIYGNKSSGDVFVFVDNKLSKFYDR